MPGFFINSLTEAKVSETEYGVYLFNPFDYFDNFWHAYEYRQDLTSEIV